MAKVTVDENKCKGCGLCISVCPKKIIDFDKSKLNQKGYYAAKVMDMEACIGCAMCALMCPDVVIAVER